MQKQIAVGIVFVTVGVIAGQVVSIGQDVKPAVVPQGAIAGQKPTPDIEQQIRTLSDALQNEVQQTRASESVAEHVEIRFALMRYMNKGKFKTIIKSLEAIIKDSPKTDDARRAAEAIEILKGQPALAFPQPFTSGPGPAATYDPNASPPFTGGPKDNDQ